MTLTPAEQRIRDLIRAQTQTEQPEHDDRPRPLSWLRPLRRSHDNNAAARAQGGAVHA